MRLVGQKLTELTANKSIIENRPSAGGIVAASAVTSAQPDGYTLFRAVERPSRSASRCSDHAVRIPSPTSRRISTVAYFDLLILASASSPLRRLTT